MEERVVNGPRKAGSEGRERRAREEEEMSEISYIDTAGESIS